MKKISFTIFLGCLVAYCMSHSVFAGVPTSNVSVTIQQTATDSGPTLGELGFDGGQLITTSGGVSVISAQALSVGSVDGASSSQLNSVLGMSPLYFQSGDVNLSQGSVQLNETDLSLSGRNGLGLAITRTYSSQRYTSAPDLDVTNQTPWGAYSGKGWNFGFGMRAYLLRASESTVIQKVFIESATGIEEYEKGRAKMPGNFAKVTVESTPSSYKLRNVQKIIVTQENGQQLVFGQRFFNENYQRTYNGNNEQCWIEGFVLTEIRDPFGNKITYQYDTSFESAHDVPVRRLYHIIGKGNYDHIENGGYSSWSPVGSYIPTRINKIIDSFGREIVINYGEAQNQASTYKNQMVSSIAYTGIDGTPQKIVYGYNSTGFLIRVKTGDLPEKTYSYSQYTPRFKYYEAGRRDWLGSWNPEAALVGYPVPPHPYSPDIINTGKNELISAMIDMAKPVLTAVYSPFGGIVRYTYEDCLSTTRNSDQYWHSQNGPNIMIDYGGTGPVVIKKEVQNGSGGETITYGFNYPRNSLGHLQKVKYRPVKQDTDAWYFATAEQLVNPIVSTDSDGDTIFSVNPGATVKIEPEQFEFQNGMMVKHTQGVTQTRTDWDFDKNLVARVTQLKNGIIQNQVETLIYDQYYNNLQVVTKKGASLTPYAQQTTVFSIESTHRSKNLLHLPTLKTATDLTTNKSRSSFTQYNSNGQPVEAYQGSSGSGKKLKTISYDNDGRVVEEKTPLPNGSELSVQTSYAQNSNQYVITKTLNNKTSVSEYELRTGQLVKSTDPNGNVTTFQYDRYGRPIGTTYPDGSQDTIAYSADLKTTTTTSGGITGIQTIDSLGRPILNQATGQQDVKVEYYFVNLPSKTYIKQNGVWVLKSTTTYDTYLRPLQKISPDFGTTTFVYNDAQNTVTVTDPLGKQSIQKTNELGQTIQTTDAAGGITSFTYNGFGETTQTLDPRGLIHKADTDDYGKPVKGYFSKNQNSSGSLLMRSQLVYNANVPSIIDSVTIYSKTGTPYRTYSYNYNNEGKMTGVLLNNQTQETLNYEETNHSNSKGKLTRAETPDAITSYDFDNMGRIIKETTTVKQLSKTWDIQYQYNTKGQLISLRYPDGKLVEYVYNSNQQLSQMKYNNQVILTYNYNENGTIASLMYGNGRTVAYTYEKDILLSNISYNNNQYTQSYSFDSVGKINQTQHNDYINGINPLTRSYTYTNKDELKTVKFNNVLQYTHDFDANSNLTRFETKNNRTLPANNMAVDSDSDQLLRKTHGDGKYIDITYDPEGNMSKKNYMWSSSDMDRTLGYGYNYQGQLQTVSENGQILAQYGYDHKRQRVYSKTSSVPFPEKYYYWNQSGQVIGEGITGQYGTEYSVRYFYSGNEKIAMERRDILTGDTKLYYFVNNAQGTPVLIVDSENNDAVSRINLDEYGNIGSMIGAKEEVNFTGKKMDLKTGLYYFNQRYYDPELGRFLQEDPMQQTFNPYQYCGNNPLIYIDPDGQFFGWDDALYVIVVTAAKYAAVKTAAKFVDNLKNGKSNDWGGLANEATNSFVESVKTQTGADKVEDTYNKAKDIKFPKIDLSLPSISVPQVNLATNVDFGRSPMFNKSIKISDFSFKVPGDFNLGNNIIDAKNHSINFSMSLLGNISNIDNLIWFKNQVKTGAPWDFKKNDPLFESIGNFHYGVVGRAAGIPRQVLLRAAGYYQQHKQQDQYRSKNGTWMGGPPYGDDPNDQEKIKQGMDYYDSL